MTDFKPGEYVSYHHYEPYDEYYMEYGTIVQKINNEPDVYSVKKLNGKPDIWYEYSMNRISELDAFLRTLES